MLDVARIGNEDLGHAEIKSQHGYNQTRNVEHRQSRTKNIFASFKWIDRGKLGHIGHQIAVGQ